MPHLLELFSGTGSIGRVFSANGWHVTSVDIEKKFNPTICKSVLDLTPEDIEGRVDLIWGSPPCTMYSIARTTAKTPRDLEGSDRLVQRVLDLAEHYGCHYFFENPFGLLRTRPVVQGLRMHLIDYCKYNDGDHTHKARKRTCLWTSTQWMPKRELCKKDCGYCEGGKHIDYAQRIPKTGRPKHKLEELYAIPKAVPQELCDWWAEGRERLLVMLNERRWMQSKRANIVAPEHRERIHKGKWSERRVKIPLFSNSISRGAIVDLVVSLLPPWFPVFEHIMVTLNKNVECYPHRDKGNLGESVIMFLGEYTGGELCLEDGRVFSERGVWHKYDGSKTTHWNNKITSGTKYSIIVHRREVAYRMYRGGGDENRE